MEEKKVEEQTTVAGILESAFTEGNIIPRWHNFQAVSKFRSVRRAIRRGKVDLFTGIIYPNRAFNNRKDTRGRRMNTLRKKIYGEYMHKRAV